MRGETVIRGATRREIEIFERIEEEIEARRALPRAAEESSPDETPEDSLVSLVGELALLVDQTALSHYATWFWPQVRKAIGGGPPDRILTGGFSWAIQRIDQLLERMRGPGSLASAKAAPSPEELRRRLLLLGTQMLIKKHLENISLELTAMLAMRLDAGYLLEGTAQLWPSQAAVITRRLWNAGRLAEWDQRLDEHQAALGNFAEHLPALLAEDGTRLDESRFGVLLQIARRCPPASRPTTPRRNLFLGHAPWHAFLVQDFFWRERPELLESGKLHVEYQPVGVLIHDRTGPEEKSFVARILEADLDSSCGTPEPGSGGENLWLFSAERLEPASDDCENEAVFFLRDRGRLDKS